MKFLIDTPIFLWWILDDSRLSKKACHLLKDPDHEIFLSVVSAWEIAIKSRLKKISISSSPEKFVLEHLDRNSMMPLTIQMKHALHVSSLPDHHEDPFDRLLIAQSQIEDIPLVSRDKMIRKYDLEVVW